MAEQVPFHATILAGPEKAVLARANQMAMALVCTGSNPPCGVCRDCLKAKRGVHPDIISLDSFIDQEQGDMIKIEAVRALRKDAFIKPNEAPRKVYLIDRADTMNANGQNALLKLLEDGPEYAAFLLLTQRPGKLLETIRSRCAQIHVEGQESEVPAELDPDALAYAQLLATGSELDRVTFLAGMELKKPDDPAMTAFLTDLERLLNDAVTGLVTGTFAWEASEALVSRLGQADLLAWAERMRKAMDMIPFHVGKGHLLGWLGVPLDT